MHFEPESPNSIDTAGESPVPNKYPPSLYIDVNSSPSDSSNASPEFAHIKTTRKPSTKEMTLPKVGSPMIGLK